jgi:hypothetical protein
LADVVHGDAGAAATGAVLAVARAARRPQDVGFVTSACIFKSCERKKIESDHTRVGSLPQYLPSVGKVTLTEYPGGWAPCSLAANPATPRARNSAKLKRDDMFHVQVQEVTSQRLH